MQRVGENLIFLIIRPSQPMLATLRAASFPDLWNQFVQALPVIMGLVLIEGLLSVDNALAIAAMASHLEEKERAKAMNIGYIGAYGFRLLALLFASYIIGQNWIMFIGAFYLVWLMCAHFAGRKEIAEEEGEVVNVHHRTFAGTITMIALMDLSLSVDNVVAAIALSPKEIWPVYVGVTIGIIALRLVASLAIKMIAKYPVLEHIAFVLIGYVGFFLLVELQFHHFFENLGPTWVKIIKFGGIVSITTLGILWSEKPALQKLMNPVLRLCLLPMTVFASLAGAVILVIVWPFKKLINLFKKSAVG
jgi:YkoY family integral membrane protein